MCTPGTVCCLQLRHTPHPKVGPGMQFHIMLLHGCVLTTTAWVVRTDIGMHITCAGQVELDQGVCKQLLQTGHFQQMQLDVDEVHGFAAWHRAPYTALHPALSAAPPPFPPPYLDGLSKPTVS